LGVNELFFKFPLDTCTQSGSTHCITADLSGGFNFSLRNARPEAISNISSNVSGVFNAADCTYTIPEAINAKALFIRTKLNREVSSMSLCSGQVLALTAVLPSLPEPEPEPGPAPASEFVFVVDCSGSMRGNRIEQARFCLDLFIRSLPSNSFFNVVRFESKFESLFGRSQRYLKPSVESALNLAKTMQADLGQTDLLCPLKSVCEKPPVGSGVRQVFVLTDAVIEVVRNSANKNRVFAIGIGSGADPGLVEGIAEAGGGRADFIASGNDLTKVVISQLELSLQPALK
jgi:hypothetical protein